MIIFYNQDGKPIKSGSIIIMGKIDSGVEALKKYDGLIKANVERINCFKKMLESVAAEDYDKLK